MPVMTSAGENDLTSSWRIASCHLDLGLSYSSCTSWPFRMDAIGVGLGNSMMSLGVIGIGLTEWMPLGWGLGNSMMSLGVMHSFSALTMPPKMKFIMTNLKLSPAMQGMLCRCLNDGA
nr:hypothetical protein Iba_chr05fCG14190 [Ipomoea batatas]